MKRDTDMAKYLFHQGTNFAAYKYFGCHESPRRGGGYDYTFRVWAPNATSVWLVSDFCGWHEGLPMRPMQGGGIWEITVACPSGDYIGQPYKYRVVSRSGTHLKGDPYAVYSRGGADGASVILHESRFPWEDAPWLAHRARTVREREGVYLATPINIYEIHMGSFLLDDGGEYLTYRELADKLAPYVKSMGYTHVELMPIAEYPFDRSWGYQVCGFYAPTSRYGTPDDFRYFVNTLHKAGIGVILDWVPAHFPKDEWGLYEFDGGPLYEYQGWDRQESASWGTRFFDVGRPEVQSFLVSNASYWIDEFHIDGLRVDAVASMLYLDYDRKPGEWFPNAYGNNHNLEAIAFFQKLNGHLFGVHRDILMIAEESASYGKITHPVSEGGLGFGLKWNMGWANDFFDYLALDPVHRKYHHSALNFPLMYAFDENYILPVSHDEVVYGKKSLINKPWGTYEEKFRQYRTAVLLQATYPGKKMTFMGTEYGQFAEWDYAKGLEWFMLDYPAHANLREYVASLNRFYLETPALWEMDFKPDGFRWILADENERNLVAFRRVALDGTEVTVLLSFSGADTTVTIPCEGDKIYRVVFATEGTGEPTEPLVPRAQAPSVTDASGEPTDVATEYYLDVPLARMSGIVLRAEKKDAIQYTL